MVRLWMVCGLCWLVVQEANAADNSTRFPFEAFVVPAQAAVRCGPTDESYVTSTLDQGAKVVVYQQAPGGWLGIQPPEGSFSWVSADHVWKTDEADVGEVARNGVVAWIGSIADRTVEHRWQVQLHSGELVELLGEKSMERIDGSGETAWYRIAPPSGEYRWIRDLDVVRDKHSLDRLHAGANSSADHLRASQIRTVGWGDAKPARRATQSERVASLAPRTPDRFGELDKPSTPVIAPDSPHVSVEIGNIEAELGLMIAKEPASWDFSVLRERLQKVIDSGKTPVERGRARLILERTEEFEALRKRQVQIDRGETEATGSAEDSNDDDRESADESSSTTRSSPRLAPMHFAGKGRLQAVKTTDTRAPKFALVDEEGRMRSLLVPAPGVNLGLYINKDVGIRGRRAGNYRPPSRPTQPLQVLVVERVIDIERQARMNSGRTR